MSTNESRLCDWCHKPIPAGARSDSKTCSKRCRQARHRFHRAIIPDTTASSMAGRRCRTGVALGRARLAYADPPYPGLAKRYYGTHPDYRGEVDHQVLIAHLCEFDGWALSTNSASLQKVLALCPPDVRIAAWVKGGCYGNGRRFPAQAWEPLIYKPARTVASAEQRRVWHANSGEPVRKGVPDALVHGLTARTTDPYRVIGSKPAAYARWLFDLLGAVPGDTLDDIFPGSGGITRAWQIYASQDH